MASQPKRPLPGKIIAGLNGKFDPVRKIGPCPKCGIQMIVSEMLPDGTVRQFEDCAQCITNKAVKKAAGLKTDQIARGIGAAITDAIERCNDVPSMSEVCARLVVSFGGVNGFVSEWYQQIQQAPPGSKARLDQYATICKIIQTTTAMNREITDLDKMSKEEIEEALKDYFLKIYDPKDHEERVA